MRFIEGGPSIPDELLAARDEGRLVIFCGAGVSRARAEIDDFISLAENVSNYLGVLSEDPIRSILSEIREVGKRTGVPGLISADVVFDRLEQSFDRNDIEKAVAQALKPKKDVDLSAHQILIDLATTPTGKVKVVTSNFELLFEECNPQLNSYSPIDLPNLEQHSEFDGIIHNHGIVKKDYSNSSGEGFILSSSEFGKAYLADGWATRFIRSILQKYVVLFVGYSADDPPVKYLLQGLNRLGDNKNLMYAFHEGTESEADASWSTKGVKAIAYDNPGVEHQYLWSTLESWRERAINPDAWYEEKFKLAETHPEGLSMHERGQIAHIVSTKEGAKKLAEREVPIPASWLCVFDSHIRYSTPGWHGGNYHEAGEWVDPFELYGLDEDTLPKKIEPDGRQPNREKPQGAWDAFHVSEKELQGSFENSISQLRGLHSIKPANLPDRLFHLSVWIGRLVHDPALLWWAGRQNGLHPSIQDRIRQGLDKGDVNCSDLKSSWERLFECWDSLTLGPDMSWYSFKEAVTKYGWSKFSVRRFDTILKPYYRINELRRDIKPPKALNGEQNYLLNFEVGYLEHIDQFDVDSSYLPEVVKSLSSNLQLAIELDSDIRGYGPLSNYAIHEIVARDKVKGVYHDMEVLVDLMVFYFIQLAKLDQKSAKLEIASWQNKSSSTFTKLKIWAASQPQLLSLEEAETTIVGLSDEDFWDVNHQGDLLYALAQRWSELSPGSISDIQRKFLKSLPSYNGEERSDYLGRRARKILPKIVWLSSQGCNFSFNIDEEKKKLIRYFPSWNDKQALDAERSSRSLSRGGIVRTETDHNKLIGIPLSDVIDVAEASMGRGDNFLIEHDPFLGLVKNHPIRAFSVLSHSLKAKKYPLWAWKRMLSNEFKENESWLIYAIAHCLIAIPPKHLSQIIHDFSSWTDSFNKTIFNKSNELFYRIFDKHLEVFEYDQTSAGSAVSTKSSSPDWILLAINSPIGKLTSALLEAPEVEGLVPRAGFPKYWLSKLEKLFEMEIGYACLSLVTVSRNINWFYNIDPEWTKNNLLARLDNDSFNNAIWSGILASGGLPRTDLFVDIKDDFLQMLRSEKNFRRMETQSMAAFLLSGWMRNKQGDSCIISNAEMRNILFEVDDNLRIQVIWVYERWLLSEKDKIDDEMARSADEFFGVVWPKHIKIKSSGISAKLFDLAISSIDKINGIVDLVIPLMQSNQGAKIRSSEFLHIDDESLVRKFPKECLKLLFAILPEDAKYWPYGLDRVLPELIKNSPDLNINSNYVELKRRWDSR